VGQILSSYLDSDDWEDAKNEMKDPLSASATGNENTEGAYIIVVYGNEGKWLREALIFFSSLTPRDGVMDIR